MYICDYLILSLSLVFSVAFITLLERKLLGYMQHRKGPNKPSLKGLATPAADAVKLMHKESAYSWAAGWGPFYLSPFISMFLFLLVIVSLPFFETMNWGSLTSLLLLSVLSWNVYPLFLSGWGSNSSYAFLGSVRGISQSISYEISLAFLAISLLSIPLSLSLQSYVQVSISESLLMVVSPLLLLWFFSGVAETNRAPFDFAESESELVSGFNIEYGAMKFALIFLAEYGMILFLSLTCYLFSAWATTYRLISFLGVVLPVVGWIWIRATFPRYRYDLLMSLSWKGILPATLGFCTYLLAMFSTWL